jgi:hypothetical protein
LLEETEENHDTPQSEYLVSRHRFANYSISMFGRRKMFHETLYRGLHAWERFRLNMHGERRKQDN